MELSLTPEEYLRENSVEVASAYKTLTQTSQNYSIKVRLLQKEQPEKDLWSYYEIFTARFIPIPTTYLVKKNNDG